MAGMNFPDGIIGILLALVLLVWAILMFFAPFFWYGCWYRAKQMHLETIQIRDLLERNLQLSKN